jgi:hypothetical protein
MEPVSCWPGTQKTGMYLLDLWRGQTSSDIWIEAWFDLVKKWRPSFWAEEHGQIIAGVGPFLERRDRAPRLHTPRAVPKPRRQGRVRAIHARPHGDARPLCAARRTMVCGFAGRTAEFPGRQARRLGRRARPGRTTTRQNQRRTEAEAAGLDATRCLSSGVRGNTGR